MMTIALLALLATQETGSISGKATLKGPVPKPTVNRMPPECRELHPGRVFSEQVAAKSVDGETRLQWVAVYVSSKIRGGASKEPVLLDQKGCRYAPHVVMKTIHQPLAIRNSDPFMHNVHGLPEINREFNIAQRPGAVDILPLDKAEPGFRVKCDIHPWMECFVFILEHPFFAVTKEDGAFEIKDVPAGEHELTFRHEKYGTRKVKVKVEPGRTAEVVATFE